jgi:non-ribosomal peptide synthase protein (TIGR01720 family)
VSFNYLGQFDQAQPTSFRPLPLSSTPLLAGAARGPANQRSHLLEVDGYVTAGRFQLAWTYSQNVHQRTTVEKLANDFIHNLQALVARDQLDRAKYFVPVDFPLARLDQQTLNQLSRDYPQLEDVYPLSPVQQMMLTHALGVPKSEAYFVQWYCTLRGPLNVSAFQRAWQLVVARHPALRTAFVWPGRAEAHQLVQRQVSLTWERQDWQDLSEAEQQARLADFLGADRIRGFDLAEPPLMRFALMQTGIETYQFVWSHHHLLLDGWSTQPLWQEVFTLYNSFCLNEAPTQLETQLATPSPYRDYIAWLQERDRGTDFNSPAVRRADFNPQMRYADFDLRSDGEATYQEQKIRLSKTTTTQLKSFAQQHRLTLNTVLQGVWALLLRHYTGQERVTFWTVVSDRPAIAGFETMVGLLLKVWPVRVEVPTTAALGPWLAALQQQQVEWRQQTDYVLPAQVGQEDQPWFGSLLRFQNYPLGQTGPGRDRLPKLACHLGIHDVGWIDRWPYPLNVEIVPGETLLVQLSYQEKYFEEKIIRQLLRDFEALIEALIAEDLSRVFTYHRE